MIISVLGCRLFEFILYFKVYLRIKVLHGSLKPEFITSR